MNESRTYTRVIAGVMLAGVLTVSCSSGPAFTTRQKQGKRIYEGLCDKCHKLMDPKSHTDDQWQAASDKYGVPLKLRPEEIAALKDYLTRANDSL
jgi:cytochrome c5